MAAFLLVQRTTATSQIEHILGVYSNWESAYKFFHQRFSTGTPPFRGGINKYMDETSFYYAKNELSPNASFMNIYHNDMTVVNIEKLPVDAPVTIV